MKVTLTFLEKCVMPLRGCTPKNERSPDWQTKRLKHLFFNSVTISTQSKMEVNMTFNDHGMHLISHLDKQGNQMH